MCHLIENLSFCGGVGACAASFFEQSFKKLDFNPPNNPTSHYGACHFGYNLALNLRKSFKPKKYQLEYSHLKGRCIQFDTCENY